MTSLPNLLRFSAYLFSVILICQIKDHPMVNEKKTYKMNPTHHLLYIQLTKSHTKSLPGTQNKIQKTLIHSEQYQYYFEIFKF